MFKPKLIAQKMNVKKQIDNNNLKVKKKSKEKKKDFIK